MQKSRLGILSRQIREKDGQYHISSSLLLLFSTPFIVWQMGVIFYSGTTMSLFGRTPIPLTQADTTLVIAAGYLLSILALCLFPRKAVWMERILLPVALAATILMLLPFSPGIITVLFYIAAFVCVFTIGTMMSVASQHFTVDTTWRDGIISMTVGGVLIATLQNDLFDIDFTVFVLLSVLLIAMLTALFYLIPAKIEVPFVTRGHKPQMPKILFIGIWLISGFSTLLVCFASSYAESVPGGVSAIYLSAAVMAVLLHILRKRLGANSIRIYGVFFAIAVFGFVIAYLSIQLPTLRLLSCICVGFVVTLANLWVFFGAAAFRVYATRFIGAIGAGMGLILAALHSGLLEALRDNISLLYGVYAALSVALLLIYYFMEPYFTYAWRAQREAAPDTAPAEAPRSPAKEKDPFAALSEQEQILVSLILAGHTESSVAKAMNITLNTQKSYRKNVYAKLDIHSKRELFDLATNRR